MQFRKTAVAVAIAGIAAVTPQIASADTVLSGVVEIEVTGGDDDGLINDEDGEIDLSVENGDVQFGTGDALFGITTSHTLALGAEGYASVRVDSEGLSGANFTSDNVYVGLRGGFGDFRFGEVPVAAEYGQLANDLFDQTGGVDGGVSYTGVFGPIVFGANWSPEANEDSIGVGIRFNFAGLSFGVGTETRSGNSDQGFEDLVNASFGASYGIAGFSIAGHFVTAEEADENGAELDEREIIAVQLGYAIQALSFGLTYQEQETDGGFTEEALRFDAGLGLGGGTSISFRVNVNDNDDGDADDDWRINIAKTF